MYVLCNQEVIDELPDLSRSIPFKSGYDYDKDSLYYVIETDDFKPIVVAFENLIAGKGSEGNTKFWACEICDSLVSLEPMKLPEFDEEEDDCIEEEISLEDCRRLGLFCAIERFLSLTKEQNIAYVIYKLAERYQCTPLEFVNKLN